MGWIIVGIIAVLGIPAILIVMGATKLKRGKREHAADILGGDPT
jgi:hypothetical protein